jgi:MFS family permease
VGLGSIAGNLIALRFEVERPLLVFAVALLALALPLAGLAGPASTPVIAASAAVAGVGLAIAIALWSTTVQEQVPEAALSRVSAYDWLGSFAFQPLGLAIAGPLAGAIGVAEMCWLAVLTLVCGTAAILLVPAFRQVRTA